MSIRRHTTELSTATSSHSSDGALLYCVTVIVEVTKSCTAAACAGLHTRSDVCCMCVGQHSELDSYTAALHSHDRKLYRCEEKLPESRRVGNS